MINRQLRYLKVVYVQSLKKKLHVNKTTHTHAVNLAIVSDPNGETNKIMAYYPALYLTRFVYAQARKWQHLVAYWLTETSW